MEDIRTFFGDGSGVAHKLFPMIFQNFCDDGRINAAGEQHAEFLPWNADGNRLAQGIPYHFYCPLLIFYDGRRGEKSALGFSDFPCLNIVTEDGAGIQLDNGLALILNRLFFRAEDESIIKGVPHRLDPDNVPRNPYLIAYPV